MFAQDDEGLVYPKTFVTNCNIVYYLHNSPLIAIKGETTFLADFPTYHYWLKNDINGKEVHIRGRQSNGKEFDCLSYLTIDDYITTIKPKYSTDAIFSQINNGLIYWNITANLDCIYLSCYEEGLNISRVMSDDSIIINHETNKIGVAMPIPPIPDTTKNYVLKCVQGRILWDEDKHEGSNNNG